MGLERYERFKRRNSVESFKQEGDALGSHRPMIIDRLLGHLEQIADVGNIDGWLDYVDPELTYYENKVNLKREAGAEGYDSPFESDREEYVSRMLEKQRDREQEMKDERDKKRAREEMYLEPMR